MVSASKKSYSRQFGFPAVKAGKAAGDAKVEKLDPSKGEGWIYRYPNFPLSRFPHSIRGELISSLAGLRSLRSLRTDLNFGLALKQTSGTLRST